MEHVDFLVIGGGAAGLSAALGAAEAGRSVLLCERGTLLGGILNQCLHEGFGRALFGEDLTGPEFAARLIPALQNSSAQVLTQTSVLSLSPEQTALLSGRAGLRRIRFDRCILAAGCREKTFASLGIAGTRPAGIFTAGTAQKLVNLGGHSVGDRILILGSGDIGQIMARHFVESGRAVVALLEQADHVGGMARNRRECLEAYRIPVLLRTTVDEILGTGRIRGVTARNLDTGRRWEISCDTLVTALGLLPDQTLCRSLLVKGQLPSWLRLSGNCESVHDIVDSVVREAYALGAASW